MADPRRLFISFSGGETSAYMATFLLVWNRFHLEAFGAPLWDEIVILFANTGQESDETLIFVHLCDLFLFAPLGHRVVWVEAVVHHGQRKSPTAKVVTFETASRDGAPFEAAISKYGIPNYKFKDCTRSLKLRPMEAYLKELGWGLGTYDTAIGIRADEMDRCSEKRLENRILYPLAIERPTTKPQVNTFWRAMPFRLGLKGYQGNCKWCWKKSFRKHYTILLETPEVYDFPERMEATYGLVGPEFLKDPATLDDPLPPGYHRVFFRESKSVVDLRREAADLPPTFVPAPDDADVYVEFDEDLDVGGDCDGGESCEVHTDEPQLDLFGEDA